MRIYLIGCMPEGKNSDLEERIMKILLAAVNAKYIHSNLAVYSLKAYAEDPAVEIGEYTINQQKDDILMDIYKRQPDILCLSCYIWNLDYYRRNCAGNRKAASGYANLAWRAGGFL